MKGLLFTMLLIATIASHAQLSLDRIFAKAKAKLGDMAEKQANRIIDEGLDALDNKASKVSIVSTKVKVASTVASKTNSSHPTKSTPTFKADTTSMAPPAEVDKYMSQRFRNFYNAYSYEAENDPLISEVQFGYKEGHKYTCSSNSQNGSIFFDLFYFDKIQTPRAEALFTYDFYVMQGQMHAAKENPTKQGADKWFVTFQYAFQKAMLSAEKGYCLPLATAVSIIKFKVNQKHDKLTGKALERYNGQKQMYESEYYKECAAWVSANSKSCKMPVTTTK